MSQPIELDLFAKLCMVVGHRRVYPEEIPLTDTEDGLAVNCELPAFTYRVVAGDQPNTLSDGRKGIRQDTFLVEGFHTDSVAIQELRRTLFDAFKGPPDPAKPGWPAVWRDGGLKIRWAEASEPSADTDYGTKDVHDVLRYFQFLLTLTYHGGCAS